MKVGRTLTHTGKLLHLSELFDKWHEVGGLELLVVMKPETTVTAIPRESQRAGGDIRASIRTNFDCHASYFARWH